MESQIQIKTNNLLDDPSNAEQIRKLFAPTLTELEFQFFMGLCRATGLNPFCKEIWSVKYGSGAAQVFIGRDGYRRAALSHPDYDYHQCDTVYENDGFEVSDGQIKHTYNLKDRGKIVGAYCITKRLKASRSVYVFVKFAEYNTGKSLWATKPDVMIRKVAEATGLRAAFQDLLGGTYAPEEMPDGSAIQKGVYDDRFNALPGNDRTVAASHYDNWDHSEFPDQPINNDQLQSLKDLIDIKQFSEDRLSKALAYYGCNDICALTESKYKDFMKKLGGL